MTYQVNTPTQLRAVLKALRQAGQLTQEDLGRRLGVSQKRIARIEAAPGVTSFQQVAQIVANLGGRIVIEISEKETAPAKTSSRKPKSAAHQATW